MVQLHRKLNPNIPVKRLHESDECNQSTQLNEVKRINTMYNISEDPTQ